MNTMGKIINRIICGLVETGKALAQMPKIFFEFSKKWPGQIYTLLLIALINILTLFVFDVQYTIFSPLATITIWILIGIQWNSIRKSIIERNKERKADDKKRLQSFFDNNIPRIPHSPIHFLSPHKEKWYSSFYYKLRGITRLYLYVWGERDIHRSRVHGSYTKIPVNKETFFHLSLMGCIDTDDPILVEKGMTYIKEHSHE